MGDYVLGRKLGSGATGEVWLAWHRETDAPAAVKLMFELEWLRGRTKRLLDREWRAVARLHHPNIVALYDHGPDYLVLEYVDGQNLAQRLHTPIAPVEAVAWTLQLASALTHAHERGVIHRDVKPGNVLLDALGAVYLGDFGLAILAEEAAEALRGGTPGYMAPEQATQRVVGPAADQYGLARTLLDMLAGGSPGGDREAALAILPDTLPAELIAVLRRALDQDATQRWPSVAAFAAELERIDLAGHAAPLRLAPERRVRAPFGWCSTPLAVDAVAADIHRADFRLSSLEAQGQVAAGSQEAFRAATGYADFGWSMYAHTSRLGPIGHSSVLARASDLVVLAHGSLCDREVWRGVATSLCRHNAQAIVLVPDVLGFGGSPFASTARDERHFTPRALVDALLRWRELLSLHEMPTVLAGHSLAGLSLMSVTDDELGEQTSRVAVTPVFPAEHRSIRISLKLSALIIRTLGPVKLARDLLGKLILLHGPATRGHRRQDRLAMVHQFMAIDAQVLARIYRGVSQACPSRRDRLERCAVIVGKDDPVAPTDRVLATLQELHVPERNIYHLASGGHLPQADDDHHPGWTMRNAHDIARIIESMLLSSREGSPDTTALESTVMARTDTAPGQRRRRT